MTHLVSHFSRFKLNDDLPFMTYLSMISLGGILLLGWSLVHIPSYTPVLTFLFLLAFATLSAILTTSMPLKGSSGITYHIGSAVSISAVPLFGAEGAVLIAAMQALLCWVAKPTNEQTWKKTGRQLIFNLGMDTIAIFAASYLWQWSQRGLGATTLWGITLPWLLAAVTYSEINLWLLIGVLRLQNGSTVNMLEMWRADRWAAQIDILLMGVGGGLLAYAMQAYDWLGVVIFFLPIALSAYAFRLYTQQMQAHLNNLDQIIHERTESLQTTLAQLQVEMMERQRVEAELRRLATIDPLTNALNRRSFFAGVHEQFSRAKTSATPLAVLMFDLDRFKQINDRYGHAAGDTTLKYFASLPSTLVPEEHLFGRLGGEEFALCLPGVDALTATAIGERLCIHCPTKTINAGSVTFTVSVSIGVAWLQADDQSIEQIIERADQRLYLAKRQGGNRVVQTDPETSLYHA